MRKIILSILILLLAAQAWGQQGAVISGAVMVGAGVSGACSTPATGTVNEGFETATTGYENTTTWTTPTWTASANPPDPYADTTALTGSVYPKPAGACNRALYSNDAGGEFRNILANPGFQGGTRYYRFWLYIAARPGGTDAAYIMAVSEASGGTYLAAVYLYGTKIYLSTGATLADQNDAGTISTGEWHQIDLTLVTNGAIGTSSITIDSGTPVTNAAATPNNYQDYIRLGTQKLTENTWQVYIDRFHYKATAF